MSQDLSVDMGSTFDQIKDEESSLFEYAKQIQESNHTLQKQLKIANSDNKGRYRL